MNRAQLLLLLAGLWGTLVLSSMSLVFGGIFGMLIALARISPVSAVARVTGLYIQLLQGIPLLVLMGLCFYGPSLVGIDSVSPLVAATLAMTLYTSAYLGEIWRGSLQSVPRPQWEAAICLGLTRRQRMLRVVMPLAVRIATPPTVGFMVQVVKNTSVASLVVGYAELSYNAKILNNATFEPFLYFGLAGVLYFAICYPLSRQSRVLERTMHARRG